MEIFSTLELLVLLSQAFFCFSYVPQLIKNYRLRSGRGLSDGFLFVILNCLAALSFCYVCLPSPFFYRLSAIIQLVFSAALLGQRLYYAPRYEARPLFVLMVLNALLLSCCLPLAIQYRTAVGTWMGTIGIGLLFLCRFLQFAKVQRARSVHGFSYGFVFALGCASALALGTAIAYKLLYQAMLTALVGLITFFVYTLQFWIFSWSKRAQARTR